MSLNNLHRISCAMFSTGCRCKPGMGSALYCSPAAIAPASMKGMAKPRGRFAPKSVDGISKSSTRLFSTTKEKDDISKLAPVAANGDKEEEETSSAKAPFQDRVKYMWNAYGKVAIGTYLSIYITTLGSIFMALNYDVFHAATFGLDPAHAIAKVGDIYETITGQANLPNYIREHPTVGTFAVAWVMTKFTEPARLAVTVTIVPSVARALARFQQRSSAEEQPSSQSQAAAQQSRK